MPILTVNDLKAHIPHIDVVDDIDDTTMTNAVNAVNRAVLRHCGRRTFDTTTTASASAAWFQPKNWTICNTDADGTRHDFWTTSGLVVKVDDADDGTYSTTLTRNTDYIVEPVNGFEDGIAVPYYRIRAIGGYTFAQCSDRPFVQVTAAWGWSACPDDVFQAALLKAARLFKRKDSPEGVLGGFQDFGAVTVRISTREDPDVVELLRYYRTPNAQLLI